MRCRATISLFLFAIFLLNILLSGCAPSPRHPLVAPWPKDTGVPKPPTSEDREEIWYSYYTDQFRLHGKLTWSFKMVYKGDTPSASSGDAEWAGYNRARSEWEDRMEEHRRLETEYRAKALGSWWHLGVILIGVAALLWVIDGR